MVVPFKEGTTVLDLGLLFLRFGTGVPASGIVYNCHPPRYLGKTLSSFFLSRVSMDLELRLLEKLVIYECSWSIIDFD